MLRVLFVDDDPRALGELRSATEEMAGEWEMLFVESGAKGLLAMLNVSFDVVVADLLMPGMDGGEMLTHVMEKYPQTVRILLSETTEEGSDMRVVGSAHQYLSKPCDPTTLRDTVVRAFVLRNFIADEQLKNIVSKIQTLPTVPTLYLEMLKELRNDDPSVVRLGHLISQDLGMCTKMLQLVNSAFFGLSQNISNPGEAILYLGVNTVKNVVLSLQVFSGFESKVKNHSFDRLWSHSWATGVLAKGLAEAEHLGAQAADHAFISGLLHDVGKLILASSLPDRYHAIVEAHLRQGRPLWEVEQEMIGASHAEVGAYLLGLWGLPTPVVEAVALHHRPVATSGDEFSLVTALHLASVLEHEKSHKSNDPTPISQLDLNYLTEIGLQDRIDVWRETAGVAPLKEAV